MKISLLIFFVFLGTSAISQNNKISGTIKGLVVDSSKSTILSSASVHLLFEDSTVATTITKENGVFEFRNLVRNNYTILVSYTGYKKKDRSVSFGQLTDIHAGTFSLSPGNDELEGVKVISKKVLIETDLDKLIYNVDADPERKVINLFDLIRKVPSISIDGDDNIEVNGNSSYLVLMNGKKTLLFSQNISEIFKSIPASTIVKVEVIASPSSRYEAEGIGGIINIITEKKVAGGYNGTAGATASARGFSTNASATAKSAKVGISAYYGNSVSETPLGITSLKRDNINLGNLLEQTGTSKSNNRFFYFGSELSYELDTANLFSVTYNANKGSGANYFRQDVSLTTYSRTLLDAYRIENLSVDQQHGKELSIDYQKSVLRDKEKLLTLSYKVNTNKSEYNSLFDRDIFLTTDKEENKTFNNTKSSEYTFQADFVDGTRSIVPEYGIKSIYRNNESDYLYKYISASGGLVPPDQTNNFIYDQKVYAAYSSFSFRTKGWGFKTGARIESSTMQARFLSTGTQVTQKFFNIIPNISISNRINSSTTARFNFTERIERPSLFYLDPYVDFSDSKNISFGNPALKPALAKLISLGFNSYKQGVSLNMNIIYSSTSRSIEKFTTLGTDTIARTTYGNIGKNRRMGVGINGNTAFGRLNLSINSNCSFNKYINNSLGINKGFSYNVFTFASYRFKNGIRVGSNIGYYSGNILIQSKSSGYLTTSLTANKDLFKKKKVSVAISINNPFNKFKSISTILKEKTFYQVQLSRTNVSRLNFSLSYRFGGLQEDIMHKKRGIKNDDLKIQDKDNL
jgi:outer membrane cobalamin receptor